MPRKVSPADRMRREFMAAVGASSSDFSGYCRLAAQTMLQPAMEVEVAEFLGRQKYQRRAADQPAYRNGYKPRPIRTGEGTVEMFVSQTRHVAQASSGSRREAARADRLRDPVGWQEGPPAHRRR